MGDTWLNWLADWCKANGLTAADTVDRLRKSSSYFLAYGWHLARVGDCHVGRLLRHAAIEAGLLEGD